MRRSPKPYNRVGQLRCPCVCINVSHVVGRLLVVSEHRLCASMIFLNGIFFSKSDGFIVMRVQFSLLAFLQLDDITHRIRSCVLN